MADQKKNIMTTDAGRPVGDNQNSLTVGPRGPVVFEDFLLFEKMAHFNRERIPERVVHAKGSGAHGYFVCTNPDGSFVDRANFLKQTARPVAICDLAAHDVMLRVIGDCAVINARTSYRMPDGRAGAGRYTDVWARHNGQWLAIAAHVTRGSGS